ncbi:hypothetical protein PHMEG_00017504 [Phytophthora megakarya]|uniref:Reverse transcriptase n=1 Tax=Phytophthora megakarya TaxID=4795 RepID=A0A225VX67_9STRA|nr:hypothetical protein PHMEG_00017504 [Phytophthora megakarya]
MLGTAYISVMQEIEGEIASGNRGDDEDLYEHIQNEMELADYANELAALVDSTGHTGSNVTTESLSGEEQRKVVNVLKRHEGIMIASGNALPPPAYGVVCDLDIHPLNIEHGKHLSDPWTSRIGIVLKKNGVEIRLCIDYKRVNAVMAIMKYAISFVDDLLTDIEAYLWFCSLIQQVVSE